MKRGAAPATTAFLLLLGLALLVTGCGRQAPYETNFYTGTSGITLSFEEGSPPPEVYEGSAAPVILKVWNRGARDVNYSDVLVSVRGDAFYVEVEQDPAFSDPAFRLLEGEPVLHGRGYGFPEGEYVEVRPFVQFKEILGLRESPTTQLSATLCYPYETVFTDTVCVDANAFSGNVQRQVCVAESKTYAGGQGAPVAVTMVENRPSPYRVRAEGGRGYLDIIRPFFIIRVENVGGGSVTSIPPPTREDAVAACNFRVPEGLRNTVSLSARLGNLTLECTPDPLVLTNDRAYASCVLPYNTETPLNAPNYLSTLQVRLRYFYRESAAREVRIVRRPGLELEPTVRERDEHPGYVEGVPRCEFCARNPRDPRCEDWPHDESFSYCDLNRIDPRCRNASESPPPTAADFACQCSLRECQRLTSDGLCVFGQSWCPGTSYCCVK